MLMLRPGPVVLCHESAAPAPRARAGRAAPRGATRVRAPGTPAAHAAPRAGCGVVVHHSGALGLVVVDRNTVAIGTGDVRLTFGAFPAEADAAIRFLHPLHNFAILSYDPAQLPAEARAAPPRPPPPPPRQAPRACAPLAARPPEPPLARHSVSCSGARRCRRSFSLSKLWRRVALPRAQRAKQHQP
jgi:hypothetical protein